MPTHSRSFEPLREHGFACRLRDAAANRQPLAAVPSIVHPATMFAQVPICLPKRLLCRLAQLPPLVMLHGRTKNLGHSLRTIAQPAPHSLEPTLPKLAEQGFPQLAHVA